MKLAVFAVKLRFSLLKRFLNLWRNFARAQKRLGRDLTPLSTFRSLVSNDFCVFGLIFSHVMNMTAELHCVRNDDIHFRWPLHGPMASVMFIWILVESCNYVLSFALHYMVAM